MSASKRQIAARHVRRLRTIRKNVLQMSEQWEDVDQFYVSRLEELADQVEKVAVDLVEDDTFTELRNDD
jgi:hypothetical protein